MEKRCLKFLYCAVRNVVSFDFIKCRNQPKRCKSWIVSGADVGGNKGGAPRDIELITLFLEIG